MDLKNRKRILNLPRYDLGLSSLSFITGLPSTGAVPQLPDEKMGLLKMENSMLKSGQFISNGNGGLEAVTKAVPKSGAGAFLKNNAGGIANAAMSAIDFVGTIGDISKNKISSDEMMGSGGTSLENVNGINYTKSKVDEAGIQNLIDATAKAGTTAAATSGMATGAALGSIIPGLGTAVGGVIGGVLGGVAGLFGSSKAKREAERQKRIAINRTIAANIQNRETASATALRNEFNRENKTDESQSLFHAEKGKEGAVNPMTMETYKKHIVNTAYGKMFAPLNAWVSDGEVIKSADGSLHRVKGGKNDTARAYLQAGDSVYSKKVINPETGNSIADDAAFYAMAGQLDRLDMNLNVGRMMLYTGKRKGNILPGYLGGTNKIWNVVKNIGQNLDLENVIPTVTAFTTAALRDAQAEGGLRAPKSFVANPYENDALQQLNSLHSDYYPVWTQNRELEARGKSAIAQSGGLSAGQRMLGYMGLANKTQQNNAAALFEHQGRENALRAQDANAALQAGNLSATRQQQAYQWDEDMLAKANAARLNMWETSAYDRQNALESFFHNRFKKQQFDRTMNLYESQQKDDAAKTKAIVDNLKNNTNKPAAAPVSATSTYAKNYQIPQLQYNVDPFFTNIATTSNVPVTNITTKVKTPVQRSAGNNPTRRKNVLNAPVKLATAKPVSNANVVVANPSTEDIKQFFSIGKPTSIGLSTNGLNLYLGNKILPNVRQSNDRAKKQSSKNLTAPLKVTSLMQQVLDNVASGRSFSYNKSLMNYLLNKRRGGRK